MIPVVYIFAYFLGAVALIQIVPAVVAIGLQEGAVGLDFLISSALWLFVAGAIMLSLRGRERRLRPAQRYLLALMIWTLLPVVAAIPLLMTVETVSFIDAYFEAVSGLTTTGSSVLPPPEELPRGVVVWLAMVQWLGGGISILVIILALAPSGVGGLPEAHSRMIEHGGMPEGRRLGLVLRDVLPIYIGATAIIFLLLAATDLKAFEALCLAFSAVSTSGFTPRSGSLSEYVSDFGIFVLVLGMLYGATNVLWHRDLMHMRFARVVTHRESLWVIGVCLGLGLMAGYAFYAAAGQGVAPALRDGIFTATSLVTTTGLEIRNASFEIFPITVVAILVLIGGTSFSTAGGIKYFRAAAMLMQANRELRRLIYPHGIRPSKLGGQPYSIQIMKAIWAGAFAFIATTTVLSLVLAEMGIPYVGAVLAALSAVSNIGPVYTSDWAIGTGWPGYGDLEPQVKLAICFGMIIGRLQMTAMLGLIVYVIRRG